MIITDTWTQISPTGAVLQRHGTVNVSLAYAADAGSIDGVFVPIDGSPQVFPTVAGSVLFAKAPTGKQCSLTVAELA